MLVVQSCALPRNRLASAILEHAAALTAHESDWHQQRLTMENEFLAEKQSLETARDALLADQTRLSTECEVLLVKMENQAAALQAATDALSAAQQRHAAEVAQLQQQHDSERTQLRHEHSLAMDSAQSAARQHQLSELTHTQQQHLSELNALRLEHARALEAQQTAAASDLAAALAAAALSPPSAAAALSESLTDTLMKNQALEKKVKALETKARIYQQKVTQLSATATATATVTARPTAVDAAPSTVPPGGESTSGDAAGLSLAAPPALSSHVPPARKTVAMVSVLAQPVRSQMAAALASRNENRNVNHAS